MSYERVHKVELRAASWLGSTGTVLALVSGTIVGAISGNVGAGIMTAITMYLVQRFVPGAGIGRADDHTIHVDRGVFTLGAMHFIKPTQRMALPEILKEEVNEREELRLRLRTRFRIIDIGVANTDEANTIIDAIGLKGAGQVSAFMRTTPLPNWTELGFLLTIPAAMILLASVYWSAAVIPIVVVSAFLVLLATVARIYRAEVEAAIGRDGITVRQGWLPPRFIRHSSVASVKAEKSEILLELAGGERMRFSAALEAEPTEADFDRAKAIAERMEKDRAASAELPAAPPETPGLLRGPSRSTKDWLDALRKLGEGGETAFRDAAPPRDQLWQIIESIDAPAIERIAAAVALKTSGLTPEEAPRLRIAAEGAVEPKLGERLRVVLSENEVKEEALVNVLEEAQREEA